MARALTSGGTSHSYITRGAQGNSHPAEESTRSWGRTASAFLERLVCRAASRWNHYTGRQEWTAVVPDRLLRIPLGTPATEPSGPGASHVRVRTTAPIP